MRVLIIEDDADIAANLYDYLEAKGHNVDAAADGVTGLHLAVSYDFDVILLDLGLPGMDGITLCRKIREEARRDTPILMITARDTLDDKLKGFTSGADDYLIKPFALREVEARMLALAKRYKGAVTERLLKVGDITFDVAKLTVERAGRPVRLPRKCLRLLELLMSSPNRVFSRSELEHAVWGEDLPSSDTLRSHMHTLRRALVSDDGSSPIQTVHGMGYKLVADSGNPG